LLFLAVVVVAAAAAEEEEEENGHSRSFKVLCFGVSGKAIRH